LFDKFPFEAIVPTYKWAVRYAEPEEHLDRFTQTLMQLKGIRKDSKILGLSFKDTSLLRRLKKKGFKNVYLVTKNDLEIDREVYGPETIQHNFTSLRAGKIASKKGKQDIVIIRHLLEHAYDPVGLVNAARELLRPGGYLVLEIPGVDKALRALDYTTVWEEHVTYFTRQTFRWFFPNIGYSLIFFKEFRYILENSIIGIGQMHEAGKMTFLSTEELSAERKQIQHFADAFIQEKKKLHKLLKRLRKTVLFGAGHLGCVWVNLFDLSKYVLGFIDEDRHKVGMFTPGCHLPVRRPGPKTIDSADLCLLSSNPNNEKQILKRQKKVLSGIMSYASIFPQDKTYIFNRLRE
jgi:SAM-dependent methyltransferase